MRFSTQLGSGTYRDREDAGAVLGDLLADYRGRSDVVVLGLVRGGVPVAAEVARHLDVPLDVLVVRKLGVPWAPEVAFGAVGPEGVQVLNQSIADRLSRRDIDQVTERETAEVQRRELAYRPDRPPLDLTGKVAIVVDDGLATGATARAAVEVAYRMGASSVVVAVPVGSVEAAELLDRAADRMICPLTPTDFGAVSRFYQDFHQVTDSEVRNLLAAAG
ncbi:MAG TPA: phosphoribosyltransferase family protein [Micromonosporaceae bacterium]|jgi:predicted phosphoribosyltransferase